MSLQVRPFSRYDSIYQPSAANYGVLPMSEEPSFDAQSSHVLGENQFECSLTARRRKACEERQIQQVEALQLFTQAKLKLRGVLVWKRMYEDLVEFGTSSHLLNQQGLVRVNIHEKIKEKELVLPLPELPVNLGWLFRPESALMQAWNMLICVMLLYVFTVTPWVIAFEHRDTVWFYAELVVDSIFALDILVILNSPVQVNGQTVASRWRIFKQYLTGLLLIDLLAVFPFFLIDKRWAQTNSLLRILRVTTVTRLLRTAKLGKALTRASQSGSWGKCGKFVRSYIGAARLLTVVYVIVVMAHFTACMWYFTARLEGLGPDTWVVRHGFQDSSKGNLYLASLYWAFTILSTVGFGDITAYTTTEMTICIVWMIFGVGIYSILVGTLTAVVTKIDAKNAPLKETLKQIEQLTRDTQLNKDLYQALKKEAVEIQQSTEQSDCSYRIELLAQLSQELGHKVCLGMYQEAVQRVPFLCKQDMVFVNFVVPRLQFKAYGDSSIVYMKNDHPDNLYFVPAGRLRYVSGNQFIPFKTIVAGSYFGEFELFDRCLRYFTVVCERPTELLLMSSSLFEYVLEHFTKVARELLKMTIIRKAKAAQAMQQVTGSVNPFTNYAELSASYSEKLSTTEPSKIRGGLVELKRMIDESMKAVDTLLVSSTN